MCVCVYVCVCVCVSFRFVYETEKFNGVAELLEILGRYVHVCRLACCGVSSIHLALCLLLVLSVCVYCYM